MRGRNNAATMIGWKFLRSEDLCWPLKGQLRFRRLMHYRILEIATGDNWIGDADEGVTTTWVTATLSADDPTQEDLRRHLKEAGVLAFNTRSKAQVILKDIAVNREIDCLVMCLSAGGFEVASEAMCRSATRENYDACVEISDIEELVTRIKAAELPTGRPISEDFDIHVDEVRYDQAPAAYDGRPFQSGDPFRKAARYQEQAEWRVALVPKLGPTPEVLDIAISPEGLLSPIAVVSTKGAPSPILTRIEAIDQARALAVRYREDRANVDAGSGLADLASIYLAIRSERPDRQIEHYLLGNAARIHVIWRLLEVVSGIDPDFDWRPHQAVASH